MERLYNSICTALMVIFAGIAAWYAKYPPHTEQPGSTVTMDAATPWWVWAFAGLAIALFAARWVPLRWAGFEFFPDRAALHNAKGPIANRFASVSNVSALWVVGQKAFMAGGTTGSIKRLLLPHPDQESFKQYVKTSPHESAGEMVKEITALATKAGTKVRWYSPFAFHSIILADIDKPTGWMHIESVFPHSKSEYRPSYTVSKKHSPDAIAEMQRIFDEIWDKAQIPNNP